MQLIVFNVIVLLMAIGYLLDCLVGMFGIDHCIRLHVAVMWLDATMELTEHTLRGV